jgi:hypothetical protein
VRNWELSQHLINFGSHSGKSVGLVVTYIHKVFVCVVVVEKGGFGVISITVMGTGNIVLLKECRTVLMQENTCYCLSF